MHLTARSHDLALIKFEIKVEMLESVILDRAPGLPQRLEFRQPFDGKTATQWKPAAREPESPL